MTITTVQHTVQQLLLYGLQWLRGEALDHYPSYVRVEIPISQVDILGFCQAQKHLDVRHFWADRNGNTELGGLGVSDRYSQDQRLIPHQLGLHVTTRLQDSVVLRYDKGTMIVKGIATGARYVGGVQFSDKVTTAQEWASFGTAQFVLPTVECNREGDDYTAGLNLVFSEDEPRQATIDRVEHLVKSLVLTDAKSSSLPTIKQSQVEPDQEQWGQLFHMVKQQIENQTFQKVVLARRKTLAFESAVDPFSILQMLRKHDTPCFSFCFQVDADHSFFGFSPELLFRKRNGMLYSEAVAGTRHRGQTEPEDQALANELMQSAKDRVEHQYVSDQIRRAFQGWCNSIEKDPAITVLKTPKVQHLYQEFKGKLKESVSDMDILTGLHPTSAVCGLPKALMRSYISQLEPFERGWYAGAVGCIGLAQSTFAVAIRSALQAHDSLHLYSGVGLVEDSDCSSEWQEMNDKLELYMELFR